MAKDQTYLQTLKIRIGQLAVNVPTKAYADLPMPDLKTLEFEYYGNCHMFGIEFAYGRPEYKPGEDWWEVGDVRKVASLLIQNDRVLGRDLRDRDNEEYEQFEPIDKKAALGKPPCHDGWQTRGGNEVTKKCDPTESVLRIIRDQLPDGRTIECVHRFALSGDLVVVNVDENYQRYATTFHHREGDYIMASDAIVVTAH